MVQCSSIHCCVMCLICHLVKLFTSMCKHPIQQLSISIISMSFCGWAAFIPIPIEALLLHCRVGFREFTTIPNYYVIHGKTEDAFLYCCYTNGGVAFPHTFRGYLYRYCEETRYCLAHSCNNITKIVRKLQLS